MANRTRQLIPSDPTALKLAFFAHHSNPALLTLLNAIRLRGHKITVFAEKEHGADWFDHNWSFPFLEKDEAIRLADYTHAVEEWDVLFVCWNHARPYAAHQLACLEKQVAAAQRIVIVYDSPFGNRAQTAQQELRVALRHWRWLRRAEGIVYMHESPAFSLPGLYFRRHPMPIGPAIQAFYEPELREQLFAPWDPRERREYRLLWMGARTSSQLREKLVGELERELNIQGAQPEDAVMQRGSELPMQVCWGASRSPSCYYKFLRKSNFVLCLPGVSWTHRPYEGLASGAIPIVDAYFGRMHAIDFRDGENCILVRRPDQTKLWLEAIERACATSESELCAMRKHIADADYPRLNFDVYFQQLVTFLGV